VTAKPRVVVIGASGWIGRRVAELAGDHTVGLVRDVNHAGPRSLVASSPREVATTLRRLAPSVVINCAGRQRGTDQELAASNVDLVALIAEVTGGLGSRLIHLGSAAEYGDPGPAPVSETADCEPLSAYGATKLAGTQAVTAARSQGADAVVLRPFNVVGPGARTEGPVSDLVRAVRDLPSAGGEVTLGNATMVRDFVTLDFVVRAVLLAIGRSVAAPVLNVCTGQGLTLGALGLALAEHRAVPAVIRSLGWPVLPHVVGDPTLLQAELGLTSDDTPTTLARAALS
jgi:nucleoside-diphosphate-sugar epimerase